MGLTVGIIGLPQSGKTAFFNALTRAGAQISGYPTSTVQANRAVVEVPDERLPRLAEIFNPAQDRADHHRVRGRGGHRAGPTESEA